MNEKPVLVNDFSGGVVADIDPQKVGNKVMTYSLNGRVIYNRAGTLSWNNGNGNKLAIALGFNYGQSTNYRVIGGIEISNYLILFSTQNTVADTATTPPNQKYSEIGLLTENQQGVFAYQTIFNDQYDPNGDLLHFNTRYQCKARAVFENKDKIRGYWVDDYNEDRVFNVVSGQSFGYLPVGGANPGNKYVYWYSVHGMSDLCDVQFGLIKYQKNISGSKIAGVRQYFYRLVHMSGYATPWSTGSGMIFVTVPDVNPTDWTQYCMVNSGTQTNKGHQLEIKYIDTRFTYIEVAWAYYASDVAPQSAGIFFQGLITGTDMIISDINETVVTPIPDPTVLVQRYNDVLHSKTQEINENYRHKSNVVLRGVLEINTANITVEPMIRLMASDITQDVNTTPLTNGFVTTNDFVEVELFEQGNGTPFNEQYVIGDNVAAGAIDYVNYKGTQWNALFKGEFRGQTVPLGLVVFGVKGQPFFVQDIGDFTMPDQFGNTWKLEKLDASGNVVTTTGTTRNDGINAVVGDYTLTLFDPAQAATKITNNISLGSLPAIKILGKLISGIDLTDILYDKYGKLQVSGFSIVRADRIPNLIAQGLVMNVSNLAALQNLRILNEGNFITPLHSTGNAYFDAPSALPSPPFPPTPLPLPTYLAYQNAFPDHGGWGGPDWTNGSTPPTFIAGNYFTLELPDNLINPATIQNTLLGNGQGQNAGCSLQLVGNVQGCFIETVNTGLPSLPPLMSPTHLAYTSFYSKNYITDITPGTLTRSTQGTSGTVLVGTSNSPGDFGSLVDIEKLWTPSVSTVGETTGIDNFKFTSVSFLQEFFPNQFNIKSASVWHGLGTENQVVIKSTKYANACLLANDVAIPPQGGTVTGPNPICYYLANIVTGQENVLNRSIIANRIYKSIGHFVPINPAIVAAATQNNGRVVFNNCEVWGGDCYVDYFGYGRLIPLYDNEQKPSVTPQFFDYGCGLIFPCETVNNHTMRIGNTFPSVALRPGDNESTNGVANPYCNSGLFYNFKDSSDARLEDFELNAVMQATDAIEAYSLKGIYYVDEPDQPLMEMVSNVKINGETYDQFRLFLVNNTQQADSIYGWVCDLEAIGINIYVLQEKGFGRIRFNERTLETTSAANLTVGTGQGYQGHDYLGGAEFGCQHEWSVYNNRKGINWVNAYKGKDCHFGGNGLECLSDIHGQHTYYTEQAEQYWQIPAAYGILQDTNENLFDNPCDIGGITTIYDYRNKAKVNSFTGQLQAIFNHITEKWVIFPNPAIVPSTMEYNDSENSYQGNWSYNYNIYFSFKQDFFAPDNINTQNFYQFNVGAKGSFSGVVYNSKLEFIVKSERQFIFDNVEIDTTPLGATGFLNVVGTTVNGQQTILLNDPSDTRPRYRNSSLVYPIMAQNQSERLRGSYLDILYEINNTLNVDVLVSENRTFIRKDYR